MTYIYGLPGEEERFERLSSHCVNIFFVEQARAVRKKGRDSTGIELLYRGFGIRSYEQPRSAPFCLGVPANGPSRSCNSGQIRRTYDTLPDRNPPTALRSRHSVFEIETEHPSLSPFRRPGNFCSHSRPPTTIQQSIHFRIT